MDIHLPFDLAGRVLQGGFFIISGLRHFQHLPMMAGFTGSKGVPARKAVVIVSGECRMQTPRVSSLAAVRHCRHSEF